MTVRARKPFVVRAGMTLADVRDGEVIEVFEKGKWKVVRKVFRGNVRRAVSGGWGEPEPMDQGLAVRAPEER